MTPEEIAELKRLLEKATPGPWINKDGFLCTEDPSWCDIADCELDEDAALIAAAVNALPRLIAEVERLAATQFIDDMEGG